MRIVKIILLSITVSIIAMISACKGKDTPQDPCNGKPEVSANFKIYAASPYSGYLENGWYKPYYLSDTVQRTARFIADIEGAEYQWNIGAEIYNTREVKLDFLSADPGEEIQVRLIVKKSPFTDCHPEDDGVDTVIKIVTIAKHLTNTYFPLVPNIGETWVFETVDPDNPSKKWLFELSFLRDDTTWLYDRLYFNNIPKGFEMVREFTDFRDAVAGIKSIVGAYHHPDDKTNVILGLYYIDGEYYDFKLQSWNAVTGSNNAPIRSFRARRIN